MGLNYKTKTCGWTEHKSECNRNVSVCGSKYSSKSSTHNFLESGHSHMDSIHTTIEHEKKISGRIYRARLDLYIQTPETCIQYETSLP